jgi:hypothetical protein
MRTPVHTGTLGALNVRRGRRLFNPRAEVISRATEKLPTPGKYVQAIKKINVDTAGQLESTIVYIF